MKIRGDRRCKECETRWSYYETGTVTCPECGSLKSVGVAERKEHTATPVSLDLTAVRADVDEVPLRELASAAATECQSFVRQYGFIDAGELQPLDDTYLAARELAHVGTAIGQSMRHTDAEEHYLLTLLRGADDGERPEIEIVPDSLRDARGLAYATAVDHYRRDLRRVLGEDPDELAQSVLSTLREHQKRVAALDGDVPLSTAESLVGATRALGEYINGDEAALAQAQQRLDSL